MWRTGVTHVVTEGCVAVAWDAARPWARARIGAVSVLDGRVRVGTQVAELQWRRRLQARVVAVHLGHAVVDVPQAERMPDLMHQAVRLARQPERVRLHKDAPCDTDKLFWLVYLLIKLKYTFFDTAVGPRPNLARMCG